MVCTSADVLYFCWCCVLLMLCTSADVFLLLTLGTSADGVYFCWCCVLLMLCTSADVFLLLTLGTSADGVYFCWCLFFCWCFILLLMFYTSADVMYFCWCFVLLLMFYTSADVLYFCWCYVLLLMFWISADVYQSLSSFFVQLELEFVNVLPSQKSLKKEPKWCQVTNLWSGLFVMDLQWYRSPRLTICHKPPRFIHIFWCRYC